MFKFLSLKLLNKKWLNACLLLGIILLVGALSCNPMFKDGSLDMMIVDKFDEAIEANNQYSAVIGREGSCDTESFTDSSAVMNRIQSYEDKWLSYIDVDTLEKQTRMYATGSFATSNLGAKNKYLDINYMPDLEDHIQISFGAGLEDGVAVEGTYPCILSEQMMDNYGFVVGEVVSLDKVVNNDDEPLLLTIVGVFTEKDNHDIYWYQTGEELGRNVYVSQTVFDEIVSEYDILTIYYNDYLMLDYADINHNNALDIQYYTREFQNMDSNFICNFNDILKSYETDTKTVSIILWVLELPIIVLLIAFIYMLSSQILEMEDGEIAMLKSRGTSTWQIVSIYLGQSSILSVLGIVLGIPLGYVLCKMAASSTSFLKFGSGNTSFYRSDPWMLVYSLVAALIAILFMTLPVFKYARKSIVEQKSRDLKVNSKPFWEKSFLDIILAFVSIYLLYNYNKQKSTMAMEILSGKNPDPMIFLDSSLFIFAIGLLILRLIKYLVKLIYLIGRKHWSPAVYASFLQITRTTKKQGFISVFLVMTIAMGMFNSVMARTINQNNEERISYNVGADMVLEEYWPMRAYYSGSKDNQEVHWYYEEPDFGRFTELENDLAIQTTRVLYDNNTQVKAKTKNLSQCIMMGINTKEFGETAELKSGLNDEHWYNYLNSLAEMTNGAIISSNMAEKCGIAVGDTISLTRFSPIKGQSEEEETIGSVSLTVCAIADAWPGFEQYVYEENENGETTEVEKYLVVTNYAYTVSAFSQTPYQVWINMKNAEDYQQILDYIEEQEIVLSSYESAAENIVEMQESPMVLITNGLFSLSFLIAIILCTVGFLIYWITSIKQRELLFGIYRAMGMSMGEINKMLINEQIFSSFLAGIAGYGVGTMTVTLFVKLIAVVYLPESHNIAIALTVNPLDIIKLSIVVVVMFIICFIVIRTILKRMNITQALKLGED